VAYLIYFWPFSAATYPLSTETYWQFAESSAPLRQSWLFLLLMHSAGISCVPVKRRWRWACLFVHPVAYLPPVSPLRTTMLNAVLVLHHSTRRDWDHSKCHAHGGGGASNNVTECDRERSVVHWVRTLRCFWQKRWGWATTDLVRSTVATWLLLICVLPNFSHAVF